MKNYTKERYKNKEEWLKNRGLGGTSASAITGNSKWKDKLELFNSIIIGNEHETQKTNESLMYGTACEPLIRKQFELDFANKYKVITPKGYELYRRKDKPYMTATPDSLLIDLQAKKKGIQEIKTHDVLNREDAEEWNGSIPQNYFEQVIWYLAVMDDIDFVEVTAKLKFYDYFDEGGKKLLKSETRYYYIAREDVKDSIKALETIVTRYWEENIIKGEIPNVYITF
jgi:predicted phage-related endonuclease